MHLAGNLLPGGNSREDNLCTPTTQFRNGNNALVARSHRHPHHHLGMLALLWLVLRSGTKPTRLSYPCQQSALGLAAATFGGPLVLAILAGREKLLAFVRRTAGRLAIAGLASLVLVLAVIGSSQDAPPPVMLAPPSGYHPDLFLVNNARGPLPGRFGGIDDLSSLMGSTGYPGTAPPSSVRRRVPTA